MNEKFHFTNPLDSLDPLQRETLEKTIIAATEVIIDGGAMGTCTATIIRGFKGIHPAANIILGSIGLIASGVVATKHTQRFMAELEEIKAKARYA